MPVVDRIFGRNSYLWEKFVCGELRMRGTSNTGNFNTMLRPRLPCIVDWVKGTAKRTSVHNPHKNTFTIIMVDGNEYISQRALCFIRSGYFWGMSLHFR